MEAEEDEREALEKVVVRGCIDRFAEEEPEVVEGVVGDV